MSRIFFATPSHGLCHPAYLRGRNRFTMTVRWRPAMPSLSHCVEARSARRTAGVRNKKRSGAFYYRLTSRGAVGGRYAFDVPALRDLQRKHADVSRWFESRAFARV